MEKYYNEFLELLEKEDRFGCVNYAINLLEDKKVNIQELYENVIKSSIRNITCKLSEKNICKWKEHERSTIIRTVIESCYRYVVEEAKERAVDNRKKVVVLCPKEEYNDLEARMITDFFMICGYESTFVGSNIPTTDFLDALEYIKPDYIVISITNYYNLINVKHSIDKIREKSNNSVKIFINGDSIKTNQELLSNLGIDSVVENYSDILKLGGE